MLNVIVIQGLKIIVVINYYYCINTGAARY